ncbi:MAG: helix-turn-helix domain-containing protein [Erysipelotrichaceae bacterium]|nr:helix-turn-helix domain-containing protein [Erysipelotrichaceae bacterium]
MERLTYNTKQAVEYLGINRSLLDSFRKNGIIRAIKVGRYYLYPEDELKRFVYDNLDREITKDGVII